MGMSWAMTYADIPYMVSDGIESLTSDPVVTLLLIKPVIAGHRYVYGPDTGVADLYPDFPAYCHEPEHEPGSLGIMMTFNLCIGICTPPVGSALFVGSSVADVPVQQVIKAILPFYLVLFSVLMIVTFFPAISLALPELFGF